MDKMSLTTPTPDVADLAGAAAALGATVDELLDLAIGELEDELAALRLRPLVTRRVKKEWATLKEGGGAAPPPHSYAQPMYAQLQAQQPVVTVTAQPIAILQPCAQQFMYAQPQIVQQQQTDVSVNGAGVPGGPSPSPPAILPVFQYLLERAPRCLER